MASSTAHRQDPASAVNTLPSSWYHSAPLYELERRAIFSKKWLQITHQNRFPKVGDYAQYEMAGYPFFIIKNRQGRLGAFHNICRHRAFPVVTKKEGNASILACGYHGMDISLLVYESSSGLIFVFFAYIGWSYGLDGDLAKAPSFQVDENFKREDYCLFPIHLHIDQCGFAWVNFEASAAPTVSWEEQCAGADTQERLKDFNMDDYVYDHSWEMDGSFNWKTLIDNYNEVCTVSASHVSFFSLMVRASATIAVLRILELLQPLILPTTVSRRKAPLSHISPAPSLNLQRQTTLM
jgi:phenylpropionate dioxygenase-like ring-hydroxylating dioxygenase large terminal subunit